MTTTTLPEIGTLAPDFKLRGPGGAFITLAEYRGRRNVVLAFYPLAFSPVCSHQLPAIAKELPRIEALGATVLGISVDSHYANEAFARSLGVPFPLLSDFDRSVSTAYGMLIPERGYSGRALFVVDRQGRIAYRDAAPTPAEVPDQAELLAALAALQ